MYLFYRRNHTYIRQIEQELEKFVEEAVSTKL